jgi:cyanophycinase
VKVAGMQRRTILQMALLGALTPRPCWSGGDGRGKLLVIGGAEDRTQDRLILRKFMTMCGGPDAPIRFVTAASSEPAAAWQSYSTVFESMGARNCSHLPIASPEDAAEPEVVRAILESGGIFMTGGDQSRLMSCLWGSPAFEAIHHAFHEHGCCVAGTSAGAAVMSRYMLAHGPAVEVPEKDAVSMDLGLGLVPRAVIDQHFWQRRRLRRLLSVLAQRPEMLGVGIDEDTALLIEPGQAIEVLGQGAVTVIDCSEMNSNFREADETDRLELLGVRLHLLPTGHRYQVTRPPDHESSDPGGVLRAIEKLVEPGPLRLG